MIMFTKPNCIYCTAAKSTFERKEVPFTELSMEDHSEFIQRLGVRTAPYILKVVGGYDNLQELLRTQKG